MDQVLIASDSASNTEIVWDLPDVDGFVGAELDRYHTELRSMMQHANHSLDIDPIVHLQTKSVVGAEALARFPGTLSTARWFELAHALDIGGELELMILDAVIDRAGSLTYGFVGVNLSPAVLVDPECIGRLTDMDDDRFVIEITDQTTLPELGMLHMHLDRIRDAGVQIAIHGAEFGPEAMRSICGLGPDIVKLSPALTAALAAGETDPTATETFFARCRFDGTFVVAVGVEHADQVGALERQHVDAYQGRLARAEFAAS